MKATFIGTGAADWPAKREGKISDEGGHRYLSSMLIDGELLIDPGPCVFDSARDYGIELGGVRDIIVTHSHSDHYNRATAGYFAERGVKISGDAGIAGKLPDGAAFTPVKAFETFRAGRYEITPVPANHKVEDTDEQPLHYIISDGEKTLFYGLDGAWLYNSTSHELRAREFDMMVFDCTCGDGEGDFRIFEHNTIKMVEYMLTTIRVSFPTMLKPGCRIVASHMARTLHTSHAKLRERLSGSGIIPAYDGLTIEL